MSVKIVVFRVACEVLGADEEEISLDSGIVEDLGADQDDLAEFIAALEDELEIEVSDSAREGFETLRDVVEHILEIA